MRGSVVSFGANYGPVGVKTGIGFDTGARLGTNGGGAKFIGTGIMIDKNEGIEFSFWATVLPLSLGDSEVM